MTLPALGKTINVGPGTRQGLWYSLSARDGLPYSIYDILQDRDGRLWMAAGWDGVGVCCFDGSQFTFFTTADGLPSNMVLGLLQDRHGHLWFATREGAGRFDGRQFSALTTVDGLVDNQVKTILEDGHGHLWFGTQRGISRYDGQTFTNFTTDNGLADNQVNAILKDQQNRLWCGTASGVSHYDGSRFINYPCGGSVRALAMDHQGTLWAGTRSGQLSRWEGGAFVPIKQLFNGGITAITTDDQGHLWCASGMHGVYRFNGTQWSVFTQSDGLVNNQVHSLKIDQQGNLWCGTFFGMSRYDQASMTHFTTAEGLVHNGVMSILEDRQGRLWFGTWDGVSCYDGKNFTRVKPLDGWAVWSIVEDRQGHLWFACAFRNGVLRFDGEQYTHYTTEDGLANNGVQSMLEDRQGRLWFGTSGDGVSCFDGQAFKTFTSTDGLAYKSGSLHVLLEDHQGQLWFGCAGGGVSCYDGRQFTPITAAEGLVDEEVPAILEDHQGRLWFGGTNSLSCYDGNTFTTFTTFTPTDGLAYGRVMAMMEDRQGHLWIGGTGGLSRYDGRVFQALSHQEGLIYDVVHALHQDAHGDVWIGTEGGITRCRPATDPPHVRLQAVIADQRYTPEHNIQLADSQKLVVFEFQGQSLTTPPEQLAYVYQLEGYDADWQPSYANRIEYQTLPLGDYTFRVKAVDRDLNYSQEAQVRLTIEPDALIESLNAALDQSNAQGEFVGQSAALRRVLAQLHQLAPSDLTVLIQGETGTGKGLAARTLHQLSPRQSAPFVQVTCGAIPEPLIESELFGHERGAFTGAVSRRLGKVELAQGGTFFLDEIGDMPQAAQVKLLRLLEERTFERVGGGQTLEAKVRVVAATNRDLRQMVQDGTFREDLFFRLQGFEVHLPPLRERQEDIPLLALYFIDPQAAHLGKQVTSLSPGAEAALVAYRWPGNVRELQHAIERAVVMCKGEIIQTEDLTLDNKPSAALPPSTLATLEENERRHIRTVLDQTGGRISGPQGAATILGVPESTLRARMKKLGLPRK